MLTIKTKKKITIFCCGLLVIMTISCKAKKVEKVETPTNAELVEISLRLINAYSTLVNRAADDNLENILKYYGDKKLIKNDIPSQRGVSYYFTTADSISFVYLAFHRNDSLEFQITISAPLFIGKMAPLNILDSIVNKAQEIRLIKKYNDLYEIPNAPYYLVGSYSHPVYIQEWGTGCNISSYYNQSIEELTYGELREYCKRFGHYD